MFNLVGRKRLEESERQLKEVRQENYHLQAKWQKAQKDMREHGYDFSLLNRYNQLETEFRKLQAVKRQIDIDKESLQQRVVYLVRQVTLTSDLLVKAGYRRLEDMSWTNEPLEKHEGQDGI